MMTPTNGDADEIRRLLANWRLFKSGVVRWTLRLTIAVFLIALAVRFQLGDLIR